MENMTVEAEWLSQILGGNTRLGYQRGLKLFKEFMKTDSTENLVEIRKKENHFETRVIQYYQWLQKEKEITSNSARAYCIGIQSLFTYVGLPLKLKNKLPKTHMKIESWKPSLEDIQKVYRLGDVSVKAWMSLSRDCPARISDLLKFTNAQIQQGEFLVQSQKENVVGKVYLSPQTQELFRQLEEAKIVLPKTQAGIDKMIASACKIAGLPKRLNQHLLRKYWISTAINLGIQETIIKVLSFKAVPQEILTYFLDREDLKDSWAKVINALPLEHTNGNNGRVNNIEQALDLVMAALRKIIEREASMFSSSKGAMMRVNAITDREFLEEYVRETDERRRIQSRTVKATA